MSRLTSNPELARAIAAARPRVLIYCAVCGAEREVIAMRGCRQARTCSVRCRVALHRRKRREQLAAD